MASFHLNVFFNCPFFSRSIRGTCKENKKTKQTMTEEKPKKQGQTKQPSSSPPLTTLLRQTQKYRDWQITHWDILFTHTYWSLWFSAQISKTAALFRRAGVFGKTQLSLQKTPLFPAISMQIQHAWKIPNTKGKTLPILKRDRAQGPLSRYSPCSGKICSYCHNHALASDETSRTLPLNHSLYSSDLWEERGNEGG